MKMLHFQSYYFQLKNSTPVFLKKVFVFEKLGSKVKLLRMFKIFRDFHINTCRSLKRRAILKIPSTVFRRTYALSVDFKVIPSGNSVFLC